MLAIPRFYLSLVIASTLLVGSGPLGCRENVHAGGAQPPTHGDSSHRPADGPRTTSSPGVRIDDDTQASLTTVAPLGFDSLDGPHAIYFVMIDRFSDGSPNASDVDKSDPGRWHGGDLVGLTEKLPRFVALGIDTVWISPVVTQVGTTLDGHDSDGVPFSHAGFHGYWADDFTTVDPHLGTEADLAHFLDRAHLLGIRVIVDVVINHFGYGARALSEPGLTRANASGACPPSDDETTNCLFGLPDIRTDDPAVATRVVEWTSAWFDRFAFDGIRFDTLKHAEPSVFGRVAARARAAHQRRVGSASQFLVVGEWWGARPGDGRLKALAGASAANEGAPPADVLLDFEFSSLAVDFAAGRLRAEALAHHLSRRHGLPDPPPAHFLSSHDTPPLTFLLRESPSTVIFAAALQMTTRGIPVVPWGEERLRGGSPWPHNRADMNWAPSIAQQRFEAQWRRLLRLRNARPQLRSPEFVSLVASTLPGRSTLIFRRGPVDDGVIVAFNRGDAADVAVPLEAADGRLAPCFHVGSTAAPSLNPGEEVRLATDSVTIWAKTCPQ